MVILNPPREQGQVDGGKWRGLQRTLLRTLRAGVLAALLSVAGWGECLALTDTQSAEYQVKAAFLYKFVNYVEWPPQVFAHTDTPLVIGVIGADTLADELAQLVAGRSVNGRPVSVRKLHRGEPVTGLQVLFIGRADSAHSAEVLASAKGQAVLTVTESDDAFGNGSVINFIVVEDKVRFDVALHPAELGNLRISARLLAVARKVISNSS